MQDEEKTGRKEGRREVKKGKGRRETDGKENNTEQSVVGKRQRRRDMNFFPFPALVLATARLALQAWTKKLFPFSVPFPITL
jgi:hypothetical protein